jgi:hypothetical protein
MSELSPELELRWTICRNLDVKAFQKLMVDEGHEEPSEEVALAAMHKSRVWLASQGYMKRELARDSKRWLEARGMKYKEA